MPRWSLQILLVNGQNIIAQRDDLDYIIKNRVKKRWNSKTHDFLVIAELEIVLNDMIFILLDVV